MIVFDASTLILVAKAEFLDLFLAHAKAVVAIPQEVKRECCDAKNTLDAMLIRRALDDGKISVLAVKNRKLVAQLRVDFSLGKGEAEAIALAVGEKAQIVAIDDKCGINACKLLNLAFTTAIAILIRSREKGLLEGPDAISKLLIMARYGRYKNSIVEDARLRREEQK